MACRGVISDVRANLILQLLPVDKPPTATHSSAVRGAELKMMIIIIKRKEKEKKRKRKEKKRKEKKRKEKEKRKI